MEDLNIEYSRLNQRVIDLEHENDYLKMLLDRLIPIPLNGTIENLEYRYNEIDKRLRNIENENNKTK